MAAGRALTLHAGGGRLRWARAQVVARHGAVCRRCRRPIDLTLSGLHPLGLTVGHVLPVSRGGTDELSNLAPEHRACNLAGGARITPPRASIAIPIPIPNRVANLAADFSDVPGVAACGPARGMVPGSADVTKSRAIAPDRDR